MRSSGSMRPPHDAFSGFPGVMGTSVSVGSTLSTASPAPEMVSPGAFWPAQPHPARFTLHVP